MLRVKSVKSPKISWCPKGIPDVSTTSLALFHASIPIDSPYSSIKNVQNHPKESINVYHPSSLDNSPLLSPIFSTLFPSLSPWNFHPLLAVELHAEHHVALAPAEGQGPEDQTAPLLPVGGEGWVMFSKTLGGSDGFTMIYYGLVWFWHVLTWFFMWFLDGLNMALICFNDVSMSIRRQTWWVEPAKHIKHEPQLWFHEVSIYQTCCDWPMKNRCSFSMSKRMLDPGKKVLCCFYHF